MHNERVITPEERIPVVPERIFLFRSCTGSMEYPGTENAIKEVLKRLSVEVVMDPDQTCCSGYLLTCSTYKPELSLAVTARNLSLAEKRDLDTYAFCNGCFGYIRELSHLLTANPEYIQGSNKLIEGFGYQYQGRTRVFHVQELYYRLRDLIAEKVVNSLKGLRVAAHYGCHYLAQQYGVLDDGDQPKFHEEIIRLLGGTPVFYRERRACCGYAVGKGFTHREELVWPHLGKKFTSAREEGVELMTTVCPGCNVALDREQPNLARVGWGEFGIPVIDMGQLIALCMGVPADRLGFKANTVPLDGILTKLGIEE